MGLWEHDTWLEEETKLTEQQQAAVMQLINDCICAGIKIADSLEYKSIRGDYTQEWDLIDKKKFNYIKRIAHMLEEAKDTP